MKAHIKTILKLLFTKQRDKLKQDYNRVLPANELFTDRWEKANYLGFGEGASVYDSCCIFGDVKVGKNTWIGPFTILDGTGGLTIGSNCSIGSGTHVYTHDTLMWAVSGGKEKYEYKSVTIADNVFISGNVIVLGGVYINTQSAILAGAYVNKDVPERAVMGGNPAKQIGEVVFDADGKPELKMFNSNG